MLVYQRVSPTNINNFAGRSSTMSLWYSLIGFSFCFLTFMEVINRCFLHSCARHSGSLQAHCEAVILTASVPPDSSCIAAGARSESRKVWTVGLLWFFRACAKCSKGTWGCWESDVCICVWFSQWEIHQTWLKNAESIRLQRINDVSFWRASWVNPRGLTDSGATPYNSHGCSDPQAWHPPETHNKDRAISLIKWFGHVWPMNVLPSL